MGRPLRRKWRRYELLVVVILALAAASALVQILTAYWWVFLIAGTATAVAWVAVKAQAQGRAAAPLALHVPSAPLPQPSVGPAAAPAADWTAGRVVPTLRGERVRSRTEARIADFLHRKGISYQYEPPICGFAPDFYIAEWNTIIEYWGGKGEEYERRRRVKSGAYRAAGYHLIDLEPGHWDTLEAELSRRLYRFDKEIYARSARN